MDNVPNQAPKPTIEDLLEEVSLTLEKIQNHKGTINITPELLADIDKLEKAVDNFKEDTDELFNLLDIDIESLKQEVMSSSEIRSGEKQLVKRTEDLELDAAVIKLALTEAQKKQRNQEKASPENTEEEKQQIKEPKKLFKTIGGDKKWIPM